MTNLELARTQFEAFDAARIGHLFHGWAEPKESDYGYRHGWVIVNGESFCRDECFPETTFPRFPADQGLSD